MTICVPWAGTVCANFIDNFSFWEILVNGIIAILTIVASVAISVAVTKRESARYLRSDARARRARMVAAFCDLCVEFLDSARHNDLEGANLRKMMHMSRISIDTGLEEEQTHLWMQAAALEIISAVEHPKNEATMTVDVSKAVTVLDERMENLRAWPPSTTSWAQYLKFIDARAIPPRSTFQGK